LLEPHFNLSVETGVFRPYGWYITMINGNIPDVSEEKALMGYGSMFSLLPPRNELVQVIRLLDQDPANEKHLGLLRGFIFQNLALHRLMQYEVSDFSDRIDWFGPGKPTYSSSLECGFCRTANNKITYISNQETIAEFFAIGLQGKVLWFVEVVITELPGNLRELEAATHRHFALLREIMPRHSVRCLILASNQKVIERFAGRTDVETRLIEQPTVDLQSVIHELKRRLPDEAPERRPLTELSRVSVPFDYRKNLVRFSKEAFKTYSFISHALRLYSDHAGLYERVYWGWVPASAPYISSFVRLGAHIGRSDRLVAYVHASSAERAEVRFAWLQVCGDGRRLWHDVHAVPKSIGPTQIAKRKRRRRELDSLRHQLPLRSERALRALIKEANSRKGIAIA
jgi:hypothetical protein